MIKLCELQFQLYEFAKSHGIKLWFESNRCFKTVHVIARNEPKDKTSHMCFTIDLINERPDVFETFVRNMVMDISDATLVRKTDLPLQLRTFHARKNQRRNNEQTYDD